VRCGRGCNARLLCQAGIVGLEGEIHSEGNHHHILVRRKAGWRLVQVEDAVHGRERSAPSLDDLQETIPDPTACAGDL